MAKINIKSCFEGGDINEHLSNPFHPYTEQELADAFNNNAQGGNPFGGKISGYDRMPTVKQAILLNVKKGLEDAGIPPVSIQNLAAHGEDLSADMPGDPETAGTASTDFGHSATLKNPNPPTPGFESEWKNEYYIFRWNEDAPAMKVERYIDSEWAAANIMPFSEARKLWATLVAHGFERVLP